jgi:hypothetical protein
MISTALPLAVRAQRSLGEGKPLHSLLIRSPWVEAPFLGICGRLFV